MLSIGPDITVTVVDIGRGNVRLGITCPKDVPVYRSEYRQPGPDAAPGDSSPDVPTEVDQ